MSRPDHDDATDRLLKRLVGLVVLVAAGTLVVAGAWVVRHGPTDASVLSTVAILIPLTTVASLAATHVRVRASLHRFAWTGAATVVSLTVVPLPWAIMGTVVGVVIAKALTRIATIKLAFNAAKDTIVVTAAGLALLALDVTGPLQRPLDHLGALALARLVGVVVDEVLAIPVIAVASRTSIRQRFRQNADLRLASHGMEFGVALVALAALQQDRKLLIALPPLVWLLHTIYSNWVRARAERDAWQRLAQTTDELNVVKLDSVLTTAVSRAGQLFSADEVEIELHHRTTPRLLRGSAEGIVFDGAPMDAPATNGSIITSLLEWRDDEAGDVGVLRLRFRSPVTLTEREQYTLSTFASALCTAIRNASAYDRLARIAEEHAHAAAHDALTGLANRRHLFDRGTAQLNQHNTAGIALLLVDLDHFKEVNDTLGHAAGDQVLVQVADRLRAAAVDGDLVARLGGDEFAVLFTGLPAPALAAHRAQHLLAALHEPLDVHGMRISVEASGGVAVAPGSGGINELLRRADVAMYHAKRSGQRLGTYSRSRDSTHFGRLALGGDASRPDAGHEFTVAFQPIVDLATGEVIAAEARARWLHSENGTDPLRILESVEQSGLLPAFAEAVLDRSLTALRAWREAGFDLPVAVNVSPRSLLDPRFPGSVLARLRAHDLPPDRLFLELTETLTISQLEVVDQVLNQLRDEGVRLALDDFGTGYSSLSVLSRIPVHELKIDPAFVTAMETSAEASAVIRSTVDLARSLDLTVVAEGLESEPQRRALWKVGCVAGQGILFARPMPAARLIAALRRGSGGRPGTLAPPLHDGGSVIRLPSSRRPNGRARTDRLPHLPA